MNLTETAGTGDERDLPEEPEPRTRLLPWTGSLGQRCYLIEDDTGNGTLSRIANRVETVQLGLAEQLHEQAWDVLTTPTAPTTKIRRLAEQLAQALADTLLIAESRGARLQHPTAPPPAPAAAATLTDYEGIVTSAIGQDVGEPIQRTYDDYTPGPTPKESTAYDQRPESRSFDQRMSTAETATQKKVREDFG
ncbi:hypothetical protein [Streptomyces bluensis]|uniref:hypothetical protein n=1 Tax=Streptomyces bluensis TaxID=33897 RepID=UPI0016769EA7|nr:hypothetical protein [Streptomyces bluensis]GGZ67378.1 hypothetical protein GCM10010344_38000 [Streptomyces bluensis]